MRAWTCSRSNRKPLFKISMPITQIASPYVAIVGIFTLSGGRDATAFPHGGDGMTGGLLIGMIPGNCGGGGLILGASLPFGSPLR